MLGDHLVHLIIEQIFEFILFTNLMSLGLVLILIHCSRGKYRHRDNLKLLLKFL